MATLLRAIGAQGRTLINFTSRKAPMRLSASFISTSKKNKDLTATADSQAVTKSEYQRKLEEHFADADPNAEKNWISEGFDQEDREADYNEYQGLMFTVVTLVTVFGGFIIMFMPSTRNKAWAEREAYLELERREKAGLVPIDENYVPVDKINLPSEEELKDIEIVI